MHDGIEIDNRGKPAAVVITEPFIATAQQIARIRGLAEYPFVIVRHPLGSLSNDELREQARLAAAQVVSILCGEAANRG